MRLFSWLFPKKLHSSLTLASAGEHWFPIVGESHYQEDLEHLAGGRSEEGATKVVWAELVHDPQNKHDRNAIAVLIDGVKVGHLGRDDAREFLAAMEAHGSEARAVCSAVICGGWQRPDGDVGHFGVKLDIKWPPEPA
jgi:hypothetical protein